MLVSHSLEVSLVAVFQNRREIEFFSGTYNDIVHDHLLITLDSAEILKLTKHCYAQPRDLTLRRLMSYIYGAPILDVSRSHTTTQHSR